MKYDFVFLLNEESELKIIKSLIESFSGKIIMEDNWGRKTLAYPVEKQSSANFYSWSMEIDKPKVAEFKRKLNFNEKLLRYLLLKHED